MEEVLKQILNQLKSIENRIETIENRMETVENYMKSTDNRMKSMENRMDVMESRMEVMEQRQDEMYQILRKWEESRQIQNAEIDKLKIDMARMKNHKHEIVIQTGLVKEASS